jgi:ABC-type transport system involved in multi-copper enzyme maturation permease subunit
MIERLGLGPVFEAEWLATSRRWQYYAGRMMFVALVFVGLSSVWTARMGGQDLASIQRLAEVGQAFYRSIVFTQLTMVLLAAPAATAGAISQAKSRGNLALELMTDLSDAEIVLGKLAARLVPVLGVICSTLPILAFCTLLGGIDPLALTGTFFVTLIVAVFACCVALAFSIWGIKAYEVLMATFGFFGFWLLSLPIWWTLAWNWRLPQPPTWAIFLNPFDLALAPQYRPRDVSVLDFVVFAVVFLGLSGLLVFFSVKRMRSVALRQADGAAAVNRGIEWEVRIGRLRIGLRPSLDASPPQWYEWHRRRPTPWVRGMLKVYMMVAIIFTVIAIVDTFWLGPMMAGWVPAYVSAFQISIGLPLIVIFATTATVEERSRGSLDILLATPLSSRAIVWAKWWSVFQLVALLLILPSIVLLAVAWESAAWSSVAWSLCFVLACAAGWTSLGLALSTWIPKLARAVTSAVVLYTALSLGFPILTMVLFGPYSDGLSGISPFYGMFHMTHGMAVPWYPPTMFYWGLFWTVFWGVIAVVFLAATLATFDRSLGRMSERSRGSIARRAGRAMPALEAYRTDPINHSRRGSLRGLLALLER